MFRQVGIWAPLFCVEDAVLDEETLLREQREAVARVTEAVCLSRGTPLAASGGEPDVRRALWIDDEGLGPVDTGATPKWATRHVGVAMRRLCLVR